MLNHPALTRLFKRPEPVKTYAFWKYDRFPYFLSGVVIEQHDDGHVSVEGYRGYRFKPFYLATGKHGEELSTLGRRIQNAYRIHEECARNAAGTVAEQLLSEAGLPTAGLQLKRTGWQGGGYEEIFRKQMEQER